MGVKSWLTTIVPLFIALATTVKSFLTGDSLNDTEVELIKYLIGAFLASGAIGAYVSVRK